MVASGGGAALVSAQADSAESALGRATAAAVPRLRKSRRELGVDDTGVEDTGCLCVDGDVNVES
jgi:hypothetical protein